MRLPQAATPKWKSMAPMDEPRPMHEKLSERLKRSPDYYIARDPRDPEMIVVMEITKEGAHKIVADGYTQRSQAQDWIDYHVMMGRKA